MKNVLFGLTLFTLSIFSPPSLAIPPAPGTSSPKVVIHNLGHLHYCSKDSLSFQLSISILPRSMSTSDENQTLLELVEELQTLGLTEARIHEWTSRGRTYKYVALNGPSVVQAQQLLSDYAYKVAFRLRCAWPETPGVTESN